MNMRRAFPLTLGFVLLVVSPAGSGESVPKFEDFPVHITFTGTPKVPGLKIRGESLFRTRVTEASKRGPNFAGQFAIAEWVCGTYCISIAVVDSKKGRIYPGPFSILERFGGEYYGDAGGDNDLPHVEYQLKSRLLVVRGCPEDHNCGTYFYEWTGLKFNVLQKIPATIPDGD